MIMDARIAAELLYESEATLRMVDTVLDELHIGELDNPAQAQGMWALRSDEDSEAREYHAPPEFCVRGYWQVHELLDCVRQARELITPERQQRELPLQPSSDDPRLDRILSVVDALDSMADEGDSLKSTLLAELRQEVRSLVDVGAGNATTDRSRAAVALLAEAEGRLTRLGHLFDGGEHQH